jgi:hypothetical protein
MSIKNYQFWNPVLDVRALQGFPKEIGDEIRDRVLSFELKDKRHLLDEIKLTVDNSDGRLLSPAYLGLGMSFKVAYGYPGLMAVRAMQCRKINGAARVGGLGINSGPNTAAGGSLTLILKSRIWDMNFERAVSAQEGSLAEREDLLINNSTVPDVVREIARRHGYRDSNLFVEDFNDEPILEESSIPSKYSSAEWISEQAQRRGWTFAIDEVGFHFHSSSYAPATEAGGVEDLSWFNGDPDVIKWNIKGDLNIPQGLQKAGIENENKVHKTEGASGPAVTTLKNVGSGVTLGYDRPFVDEDILEGEANMSYEIPTVTKGKMSPTVALNLGSPTKQSAEKSALFFENSAKRWKLQMQLVGNPKVSARKKIFLRNFGPLIDGSWIVRECTHSIKPNQVYITELEAVRDEKFTPKIDPLFQLVEGAQGPQIVTILGAERY